MKKNFRDPKWGGGPVLVKEVDSAGTVVLPIREIEKSFTGELELSESQRSAIRGIREALLAAAVAKGEEILTVEQVEAYDRLRGYSPSQ